MQLPSAAGQSRQLMPGRQPRKAAAGKMLTYFPASLHQTLDCNFWRYEIHFQMLYRVLTLRLFSPEAFEVSLRPKWLCKTLQFIYLSFWGVWVSLPAKGKAADIKMPAEKRSLVLLYLTISWCSTTAAGFNAFQGLLYLTNMLTLF